MGPAMTQTKRSDDESGTFKTNVPETDDEVREVREAELRTDDLSENGRPRRVPTSRRSARRLPRGADGNRAAVSVRGLASHYLCHVCNVFRNAPTSFVVMPWASLPHPEWMYVRTPPISTSSSVPRERRHCPPPRFPGSWGDCCRLRPAPELARSCRWSAPSDCSRAREVVAARRCHRDDDTRRTTDRHCARPTGRRQRGCRSMPPAPRRGPA